MKVLTWKCPKCGKILSSLYESQLENFKIGHIQTHKKEGDENEKSRVKGI